MAKNRRKSSRAKRGRGAPVRTSQPTVPLPTEVDRGGNAASGGTLSPSLGLSKGRERGQNREDIGGAVSADAALPLLHRLAIAYLMLPVFVWLVGWFEWWLWIPATVLLGAGLRPALTGSFPVSGVPPRSSVEGFRRMIAPRPATLAIVLLALGWTMLSAAGGVFDGNNLDWIDHHSMLLDMSRYPWPTFLPDDLAAYLSGASAPPALMRHYLGWYMVPGLVGRLSGPAALNWTVPLWTWLGTALILLLFVEGRRGWMAILAAVIFVFFSGTDLLRVLLVEGVGWLDFWVDRKGWPGISIGRVRHIEPLGLWGVRGQSTAHMSAFLWAPKHLIGAGLYTLLLLHLRRQPRFLAVSGVVLAAAPFWSAFVAMGLVPLLAVVVWDNGPRPFLRWPNLCLAAPLAGLIALYLTAGSLDFPAGWLWDFYDWSLLMKWVPVFYLSEFLTPALLVLLLRPALGREPFFLVSLATLLLLPWYSFSEFNDLAMRGGMPALLVVCHACADILVGRGAAGVGMSAPAGRGRSRRVASICLIAVLAVGALNPIVELARATRDDVPFRYEISGFTTFGLPRLRWQRENLAPEVPVLLRRLLRNPGGPSPGGTPAPAEPVVRGPFDVYVKDRQLIHVKERCRPDVAETIRVEFVPADPDMSAWTRSSETRRVGSGCGAIVGLPGYAVAAVRTGQLEADGGDWSVELRLDAAGRVTEVRR